MMNNYVTIELSEDQAKLFLEFQKRHEAISYLLGYMESVNVFNLKDMHIELDIGHTGMVEHMSITRHYRN